MRYDSSVELLAFSNQRGARRRAGGEEEGECVRIGLSSCGAFHSIGVSEEGSLGRGAEGEAADYVVACDRAGLVDMLEGLVSVVEVSGGDEEG